MTPIDQPDAQPILPSKVSLPRIDLTLFSRPRLEVQLDQAMSTPICILRAPAGFGKTTLMSYWCHQQAGRVAWYTLDDLDNDAGLFSRYVIQTLINRLPEAEQDLLRILEVIHLYDLHWLIGRLCQVFSSLSQHTVLVLDNFHAIVNPKIQSAINVLLQHCPDTLHIFILTRGDLPTGLAKMRLNGFVTEITAEDLKFTPQEAQSFLKERVASPIDDTLLDEINDRLNGWPAGLQIIALSAPTHQSISQFLRNFNGTHAHILDFLAEEILFKQSAETQEFLLKTSILTRFNPELATAVTDMPQAFQKMQTFEKQGLFLSVIDEHDQWYRYHPFFAEFLRHQLSLVTAPQDIKALHVRAYEWWQNSQVLHEALQHVLRCEDEQLIASTLIKHGWDLYEQGHLSLIEKSLNQICSETIHSHYKLALLKAWVSITQVDSPSLQAAIEIAEQHLPEKSDDPVWRQVSAEVFALKAQMCAATEQIALAKNYATQAIESADTTMSNAAAVAQSVLGECYICEGELKAAMLAFQQAERAAQSVKSTQALMWSMAQQADILFYQGDLVDSYQHQTMLLQVAAKNVLTDIPVMEFIHRRRAELCLEWLQLSEAKQHCEQALKVIDELDEYCQVPINALVALIAMQHNDQKTAETILNNNSRLLRENKCHSDWVATAMQPQLLYWHQHDNVSSIKSWLSQQTIPHTFRSHIEQKLAINIAMAMIMVGYLQPAAQLLSPLLAASRFHGQSYCEMKALLLLAWTKDLQKNPTEAALLLEQAIYLAEPMRIVGHFLLLSQSLSPLYREVFNSHRLSVTGQRHLERILELAKRAQPHTKTKSAVPDAAQAYALTTKEWQVLELIGQEMSNEDIAEHLHVAVSTVRSHIKRLYHKLGIRDRNEGQKVAQKLIRQSL